MDELQQILLGISDLTKSERELLTFVVMRANPKNGFVVAVCVSDKVFSNTNTTAIYMLNKIGQSLFNKVLCFQMHQEQNNSLAFRCVRSIRRINPETFEIGLSHVLITVLRNLKAYLETDAIEQLAMIKHSIAKYIFMTQNQSQSYSVEEFRHLLCFSDTNKEKRNWMHRHVNPAFEELKLHFGGLYKISYRREKSKIIGVDLIVK